MTPPTLPEFILARVAEDEDMAWDAIEGDYKRRARWYEVDEDGDILPMLGINGTWTLTSAEHAARHDPTRVLAQCAAIRAVVELHSYDDPDACYSCREVPPCLTLRHLAAIWADHVEYRKEWAAG